jgi:hypothetical protein
MTSSARRPVGPTPAVRYAIGARGPDGESTWPDCFGPGAPYRALAVCDNREDLPAAVVLAGAPDDFFSPAGVRRKELLIFRRGRTTGARIRLPGSWVYAPRITQRLCK